MESEAAYMKLPVIRVNYQWIHMKIYPRNLTSQDVKVDTTYVCMTSISMYCRIIAHVDGRSRKQSSNALFRYDRDVHGGQEQSYTART